MELNNFTFVPREDTHLDLFRDYIVSKPDFFLLGKVKEKGRGGEKAEKDGVSGVSEAEEKSNEEERRSGDIEWQICLL